MRKAISYLSCLVLLLSFVNCTSKKSENPLLGKWVITSCETSIDFDFIPALAPESLSELREQLLEEWEVEFVSDGIIHFKDSNQVEFIYSDEVDGSIESQFCSYTYDNSEVSLSCGSLLGLDFNFKGNYLAERNEITLTLDFSNLFEVSQAYRELYNIDPESELIPKSSEWIIKLSPYIE